MGEIKEKNIKETNNEDGNIKLLKNLKRKVDITYRTRINASNRLREKNQYYKRISTYFSILVTAISVISIGVDNNKISILVLASSICLTYYMMYISEQNIQERAYKMEVTFKELGDLKHNIDLVIENNGSKITEEECKKLFDKYSNILSSIENHETIDYDNYKLKCIERSIEESNQVLTKSEDEQYRKIKNRIIRYELVKKLKRGVCYIFPLIVSIWILYECIFAK